MGKKQKNQNNSNRGNQNNRSYNNNNGERYEQKAPRQPRVNPNEVKAKLIFDEGVSDNIAKEILDVLAKMRFDKISIPIGTYRYNLGEDVAEGDNRISTIGYIRRYDSESEEFTVIIFSNFIDIVKDMGDIAVDLTFLTNKAGDRLGTITKFVIVPICYECDCENCTCDEEDETFVGVDEATPVDAE